MEKEDIEKILNELNVSIVDNFIITTVRDLYRRYRYERINLPYDCYNLTLENIINFYKIHLLLENEVIDEETKYRLDDLYIKYLEVKSKIGDECIKEMEDDEYISKELKGLHQEESQIGELLNKYHILDQMEYSKILKNTYLSILNTGEEKGITCVKEIKE